MPDNHQKAKVVFSVINCICYDQRVLKMAETVSTLGCDITIVGRKQGDCCSDVNIPFRTRRFRMLINKGFLFYKFFNIRLLFFLLFNKFDILVANDLDTLLPNFLVSKIKGIPLVYDSHEYFTGVPEIQNRTFVRSVWQLVEKSIFPRLKYVITVSEPIASIYEKLYNIKPLVIKNLSRRSEHIKPFTREDIGIPEKDLLIIIQGNGINIEKGAEELVESVSLTQGVSLLVVGSGDVIPSLKLKVDELNISNKVRFIPSVNWELLIKYTKTADVGMCLEKDTNLNYRYSLPNKLFDYISAGIAIIASDLPETGKIFNKYGCGLIINEVTPKKILAAINELKADPAKLALLKNNSVLASEKLNWETEREKVKELYKKVLDSITNR